MPYKHKRDCPVCNKPGLRYTSDHLRQVHNLYGDERKNVLERVRLSTPYNHNPNLLPARPAHILKEMRCVRKKTSAVIKPTKSHTKSKSVFGYQALSGIKFWKVKVERVTLSNKFWKTIVSCTRSKEVSAFFGATINGKIVTTT